MEQIGIVVKDVEKATEYYSANFGWGPFQVREFEMKGFTYRGRLCNCRLKVALAHSGHIQIELIQVVEGETPHSDFIREKGEGLNHLSFRVDDLAGTLAELARGGIEPILHYSFPDLVAFAYLRIDRAGGVIFELFERAKGRGSTT